MGEVYKSKGAQVFEVMNGKIIWPRREAGNQTIKRTLHKDVPHDNPDAPVTGMGDRGGELFSKSCCYLSVAGEGFGGKGDGLINQENVNIYI